ncbi:hypothetical protein HZB96_00230 [Candidatus Gottesmanbacteria bacterium]|nr:hypothetical protein [Candidatus Gottesmanbacteria bacterium]
MNAIKRIFPYLLFIILIIPAIIPLFKPYVSGTADGLGHRFRLVSFYNSLKEGNIRPRWAGEAAQGYGAPTFLFNYPLPYYIASFFHFLGFSINTSGQLLAAASLLLSGLFMFLVVRRLVGGLGGIEGSGGLENLGGMVAAVVYTYAPYHLQMTYLYDSWGEEVAFVFPPLILYLMVSFCHSDSLAKPRVEESRSLSAIFLAFARDPSTEFIPSEAEGLGMTLPCHFALLTIVWILFILSHNVSAIMFTPVLILSSMLVLSGSSTWKESFGHLPGVFSAFFLAVLISSLFWLPALVLQNGMEYPQFLSTEAAMRGSFFKSFSFQLETAVRVIKEGTTHYLDFTVGLPILAGLVLFIMYKLKMMTNSKSQAPNPKQYQNDSQTVENLKF